MFGFKKLSVKARRVMRNGSHAQKNRLISELMKRIIDTEESLEIEHDIANGNWPDSIQILGDTLSKVLEIHRKQVENRTRKS